MRVRAATAADLAAVVGVLDAAMLDVDDAVIERRVRDDAVIVATADDRVIGACVLDPRGDAAHVDAVAVRRRRRDQGVGTALVDAASDRWRRVTADFDADVRAFYESLGFDVTAVGDGRYRGVRE